MKPAIDAVCHTVTDARADYWKGKQNSKTFFTKSNRLAALGQKDNMALKQISKLANLLIHK
jgi:hypothetical protein